MFKKIDDDIMSANFNVIVIFSIYGQFLAIQEPNSGYIVCKNYVSSNVKNSIFYPTKIKNRAKNI